MRLYKSQGCFAREDALRIANTDRARWHGNAVAFVYESHDQRLPLSRSLLSGHARVTKNRNFAGMLLSFFGF